MICAHRLDTTGYDGDLYYTIPLLFTWRYRGSKIPFTHVIGWRSVLVLVQLRSQGFCLGHSLYHVAAFAVSVTLHAIIIR